MKRVFIWLVFLLIIGSLIGYFIFFSRPRAGLQITTGIISAEIHLDNKLLGVSPFASQTLAPGTYQLTLKPFIDSEQTFRTLLTLHDSYLTVVDWQFSDDPTKTAGIVYQPSPTHEEIGRIEVTSLPDNVMLQINHDAYHTTPQIITDLPLGEHQLDFSLPSYANFSPTISHQPYTDLSIYVKLAKK
ncbi:PEGA domain-containing protein [Microgenomates group bacterium]|nr:PEGA domain-containing protein [Microgenomates group bacterium]